MRARSSVMPVDLMAEILEREDLARLDPASRRLALRTLVVERAPDRLDQAARLADLIDGFGPLDALMADDEVTDILVNGPDVVWVEKDGRLQLTASRFASRDQLLDLVHRWLAACGRRVDAASPIADGRLADGSRIHVVIPPVAPHGPLVCIRRFRRRARTLAQLTDGGLVAPEEAARLGTWVGERKTIVVSGRTGSGKTTLIGALLSLIPESDRAVTIEETPELAPLCNHWVSLVARPPNVEGKGEIDLSHLVRAALRMRPDRLVVGEVRGPEALVALSALATGHQGSLLTVHSSSAAATIGRLVGLALSAPGAPSERALVRLAREGIDVVVHLTRDGPRRAVRSIELIDDG